ncbi:MAG: hypothetical protein Q9174_002384 [Haloplaca sp. 1 TL-2023]
MDSYIGSNSPPVKQIFRFTVLSISHVHISQNFLLYHRFETLNYHITGNMGFFTPYQYGACKEGWTRKQVQDPQAQPAVQPALSRSGTSRSTFSRASTLQGDSVQGTLPYMMPSSRSSNATQSGIMPPVISGKSSKASHGLSRGGSTHHDDPRRSPTSASRKEFARQLAAANPLECQSGSGSGCGSGVSRQQSRTKHSTAASVSRQQPTIVQRSAPTVLGRASSARHVPKKQVTLLTGQRVQVVESKPR